MLAVGRFDRHDRTTVPGGNRAISDAGRDADRAPSDIASWALKAPAIRVIAWCPLAEAGAWLKRERDGESPTLRGAFDQHPS